MPDWTHALQEHADGARLRVRVAPRSSAAGSAGLVDDGQGRMALRLRLAAPPVDGRANQEAARWLAKVLGLRNADVRLVSGATSRTKVFHLSGLSVSEAARRLAAAAGGDG